MKYTNKWMVVPYRDPNINNNNRKNLKQQLSNILLKKSDPHSKLTEYNQILSQNNNIKHPVIPQNKENNIIDITHSPTEEDETSYNDSSSFLNSSVPSFNLNSTESINYKNFREPNDLSNDSEINDNSSEKMDYEENYQNPKTSNLNEKSRKISFKKSFIIPENIIQPNTVIQSTTNKIKEEPKQKERKRGSKRKKWEASKIINSITTRPEEDGVYRITTRAAHFLKKHGFTVKNPVKPSKKKPKIVQEGFGQWESFKA